MSAKASSARLRHLMIRDFRGIDRLELDFPGGDEDGGGALVLAGDNGCGKTSVLEAVLILLGRIDLLPADTALPHELVRQGAADFKIEGVFAAGAEEHRRVVDLERLRGFGHDTRTQRPFPYGAVSYDDIEEYLATSAYLYPSVFAVEYFSARREPEGLGEAAGDARGVRSTREERRLAELKRRIANAFRRKRSELTFERIERFIQTFLVGTWKLDVLFENDAPGSDPVVVLRDGELPDAPDGREWTFASTRGLDRPRVIPIDRMSSGQMSVLAMTYPFVFGDRSLDLVLLDEPEQHLHPAWQRAFLGALRKLSPSTQFLVVTHSPQVLDSVASYERREMRSDDAPVRNTPDRDAAE